MGAYYPHLTVVYGQPGHISPGGTSYHLQGVALAKHMRNNYILFRIIYDLFRIIYILFSVIYVILILLIHFWQMLVL